MHKYIIKLTQYTEAGAPTNEISYVSADTPQGIADQYKRYKRMRYTNEDGTQGNVMYKVEPMQGEYVAIDNWAEFCAVNKVLAE